MRPPKFKRNIILIDKQILIQTGSDVTLKIFIPTQY
ncbi:hypothetical protein BH18THE2_BH18THE2_39140 [soil metagenome]